MAVLTLLLRPMPRTVARHAVVLVLALCACGRADGERSAPRRTHPNILLLTIDTLRVDHLGAYGYALPTTPAIDSLAASGVRVARCVSAAPETAPAMASLLTGTYQDRHGVLRNRMVVADGVTVLAELLRRAGYTTAGFVGNHLLTPRYGFSQGLDRFEEFFLPNVIGHSDDFGAALVGEWLSEQPAQPWFLWLHFMDPHGPWWQTVPVWSDSFEYPPGTFGEDRELEVSKSNFGLGVIPVYQSIPGARRPSVYVRRYDGEIRFADAQVRSVIGWLAWMGLLDDTLIVLTADHGESLLEHDEYFQHGWFLYDTTLHVPLILSWRGHLAEHAVLGGQVSSVDIAPTILDLAGVEYGDGLFDGRSFAAELRGADPDPTRAAFAVGPRDNMPFAVSRDGWKLIYTPAGRPESPNGTGAAGEPTVPPGGRYELYDIVNDPAERQEVGADNEQRLRDLRLELGNFELRFGPEDPK